MGGHTLSAILEGGADKLHGASLIISPQTEHPLVRHALYHHLQYHLEREQIVRAAGRYYIMMLAQPGERSLSEKEAFLGPCLMNCATEEYLSYIKWRCDVVSREQHSLSALHLSWLKEEYERVRKTLDRCGR